MEKHLIFDAATINVAETAKKHGADKVVDAFKEQLEDLFLIRNPQYRFNKNYKEDFEKFVAAYAGGKPLEACGTWVFFPWSKALVHFLNDAEHQEIRTARNRNLITKEEQDKFYNAVIGVAGLSVGSHGAVTLALMGGGREIRLADPDTISATNLNRMRFDFTDVGVNKGELIARYIYQLNPYAKVRLYTDGITDGNIEEFIDGLDVLVEELDEIEMKVRMRIEAKKRKIPVVMVTDNADSVIIDIERFDTNPDLKIFHGNLEGFDVASVRTSPQKMFEAMARIIDVSLVPPRVLQSVSEVGKTIYSWPQLATAATLSGVAIAYIVRRIVLGEKTRDGKLEINLEAALDPDYEENHKEQLRVAEQFLKAVRPDATHG